MWRETERDGGQRQKERGGKGEERLRVGRETQRETRRERETDRVNDRRRDGRESDRQTDRQMDRRTGTEKNESKGA